MSAPSRPGLLVLTPWYPTEAAPYSGTFVRETIRALTPHVGEVTVVHAENRPEEDRDQPSWSVTPEGLVLRVPVPMAAASGRGRMMLLQREALRRHAGELLGRAELVHCHVGAPTGAAAAPLLPATARFVLTEHATYLPSVFRDPVARLEYGAALRRADVVTAVSGVTAARIEAAFGGRTVVDAVPNPVNLASLPRRDVWRPGLPRWLFVGNLIPHKGVRRLIRSFARWVADRAADPGTALTVVGDGVLRGELEELCAELGVAGRVRFTGGLPPEAVAEVYGDHDLLVHLSHVETFGITCVEAAAAGMAVVVTACGAPSDTLALHHALGLSREVPVADEHSTEPVVAAVRSLVTGQDAATQATVGRRLAAGREHLERCYSAAAVGERLGALLVGRPPTPWDEDRGGETGHSPGAGVGTALAVAVTPKQLRAAESFLADVADFGGRATLLTASRPRHVPPGVTARWLGAGSRLPAGRSVRLLTSRVPAAAWDAADSLARQVAGRSQRVALGLGRRIDRLRALTRRAGSRIADGPYDEVVHQTRWYRARLDDARLELSRLHLAGFDLATVPPELVGQLPARVDVNAAGWTRQDLARRYAARVVGSADG